MPGYTVAVLFAVAVGGDDDGDDDGDGGGDVSLYKRT